MLFSIPLEDIKFQHIEDFCRTWAEGVRVEYKASLVTSHIPKVVSSMANTTGGIWIIGVTTDKSANRPIFPINGFPRDRGVEERITQACYQNLYPSLFPDVRVIDVPGQPDNIVAIVQIPESVEAPHAVENTTKVYIRTNSTTETIQLAELDRIEYLLKRRQQPEERREKFIYDMGTRPRAGSQFIRIVLSPRYPWRPILGEDLLLSRLGQFSEEGTYVNLRHFTRLVRQGFMSVVPPAGNGLPDFYFEMNLHGIMSCYVPLAMMEGRRIFLDQIVTEIGHALNLGRHLLKGTHASMMARVSLSGVKDALMMVSGRQGGMKSIEEVIQAEECCVLEDLDKPELFRRHIGEVIRQLMWSFNWSQRDDIITFTNAILDKCRLACISPQPGP